MRYLIVTAGILGLAASAAVNALGSLAQVSVIDRERGVTLQTYYYRGDYWVAGDPGARYAIEIRNCAGSRLLAVTSVDGLNVLTGDTAGVGQAGYVFDAGERYEITGWRKSNAEVAAFTFTSSRDSYAGRTGRPANIGVIGVALFREQPQIVNAPAKVAPSPPMPAASAESRANDLIAGAGDLAGGAPSAALQRPWLAQNAQRLGTGHGEREYSYVVDTQFQRMQPYPNEVIRIRYDSLENLVAMGIVRKPRPTPRAPDPFPGSERFVPDPPG